jgi:hypothetical protein
VSAPQDVAACETDSNSARHHDQDLTMQDLGNVAAVSAEGSVNDTVGIPRCTPGCSRLALCSATQVRSRIMASPSCRKARRNAIVDFVDTARCPADWTDSRSTVEAKVLPTPDKERT